jgi:hypothetical protein
MMTPPPWLMWGSTQTFRMERPPAAGTFQQDSGQLARVTYGRPETWTFLLGYKVLDSDLVGGPYVVQVGFDLTVGIGRGNVKLVHFGFFQEQNPNATSPIQWATKVPSPQQVFTDATTIEQCDQFPAQDIQCQATVVASGVTSGTAITVEVFAFFSPRTHIRPEWFHKPPLSSQPAEQFRGGEDRGV